MLLHLLFAVIHSFPFHFKHSPKFIFFTVSTQTEEEYQAWARSRDEATSTPTTTSSTTSPPTTTSKVSLSDREGEDEVGPGSAYDYVADEGDYYNTELDDKRRITTSTPETTKATHRITSTTTAMPTTASPVSSTSTATYVGDYEDVDSHMARVGQEPDICVGLLDRWWLFMKDSPFFFSVALLRGELFAFSGRFMWRFSGFKLFLLEADFRMWVSRKRTNQARLPGSFFADVSFFQVHSDDKLQ